MTIKSTIYKREEEIEMNGRIECCVVGDIGVEEWKRGAHTLF